jgi:DNA-nicking Smr family endonuclease
MTTKKEDAELFREAMRDVKRLVSERRATAPAKRPRARARAVMLEEPATPASPAAGDELSFARPGLRGGVLRQLRRGQYRVESTLDLHGLTAEQARAALREFLGEARARGLRCVRIVHGKGLRSGRDGPVLRSLVAAALRRYSCVLAFVPAPPADGGRGAVYVLLRP